MERHPALWEDMHATSMLWPLMARIFPSRGRYASVMLTFAELVQWPASVTQGAYAAAPRGNSLGGLRGLTPCSFHLSEEMKASGGQISCLFSLDFCLWLWLRTLHPARRAGVVGSKMLCVAKKNMKPRPRDTACWMAWVRDDPSYGGKERDEVLNENVSETDSLFAEVSQDKIVCPDTVVVSEAEWKGFFKLCNSLMYKMTLKLY